MATIYISGPITGIPDGNRTLFAAAATFIREAGHGATRCLAHADLVGGA